MPPFGVFTGRTDLLPFLDNTLPLKALIGRFIIEAFVAEVMIDYCMTSIRYSGYKPFLYLMNVFSSLLTSILYWFVISPLMLW